MDRSVIFLLYKFGGIENRNVFEIVQSENIFTCFDSPNLQYYVIH